MVVVADLVLDGDLSCPGTALVVGADDVTIDLNGFHLGGAGAGSGVTDFGHGRLTVRNGTIGGFDAGVTLVRHRDGVLADVRLSGNRIGVFAAQGSRNTVRRAVITGSRSLAIAGLDSETRMVVADSHVADNAGGVAFASNSSGARIVGNRISNSGHGVEATESGGLVVEHNAIVGNRAGVSFWLSGGNVVSGNRIADNDGRGVGIFLPFSNRNRVEGNLIEGNDVGVQVGDSTGAFAQDTVVAGNHVRGNRSAGMVVLATFGNVTGTSITRNSFNRNGADASAPEAGDGLRVVGGPVTGAITVASNTADRNAGNGIDAVGVVDGGGNRASRNAAAVQCIGVVC